MFYITITTIFGLFITTVYCQGSSSGRPEIVGDILPLVKQQNEEANLTCAVVNVRINDGNIVEWFKMVSASGNEIFLSKNDQIVSSAVQQIANTGREKYQITRRNLGSRELYILTIRGLTQEDAGDYACRIKIIGSTQAASWPRKIAILIVQVAPYIKPSGDAVHQLSAGQNITISCDAYGIPYPNITWKREDGKLLQNGGFRSFGRKLKFVNIQKKDKGNYICIADNNVRPPDDYKVQVLVMYSPVCRTVMRTVGQAQNRRFNIKLDCICAGYPQPTVRWQKLTNQGRVSIKDDDKYDLSKTNSYMIYSDESWYTLKVKNVQANDYTEYYCIANNKYGTNETTFRIFETMECQGANCPSIGAGGTGSTITVSVVFLVLSALLSVVIKL